MGCLACAVLSAAWWLSANTGRRNAISLFLSGPWKSEAPGKRQVRLRHQGTIRKSDTALAVNHSQDFALPSELGRPAFFRHFSGHFQPQTPPNAVKFN
jgi:hypothetical protein